MTYEEFKEKTNVLSAQLLKTQRELFDLKDEYRESLPYRSGDKVHYHHVDWKGRVHEGDYYLLRVDFWGVESTEPDFVLAKIKKDGTMSHNANGIHAQRGELTKIEE